MQIRVHWQTYGGGGHRTCSIFFPVQTEQLSATAKANVDLALSVRTNRLFVTHKKDHSDKRLAPK